MKLTPPIRDILLLVALLIQLSACHHSLDEKTLFAPVRSFVSIPYRHGELNDVELQTASKAWAYFDRTFFPETGLPQGAVGSDVVTMWDIGSYLAAMVSARRTNVLDKITFDRRMTSVVHWLNSMELNDYGLPNKFYNARTGQMIQGDGKPGQDGFSALDIGRMLIWLRYVRNEFITYATAIDRAVLRFNFRNILDSDGLLHGAARTSDGPIKLFREGRLGLQQYAALGFKLWGFNVNQSLSIRHQSAITIFDHWLPFDNRPTGNPAQFAAVTTRMAMLAGLEFGFAVPHSKKSGKNSFMRKLADAVYLVQKARFSQQGRLTARDSHLMDHPPYYVIDSIFVNGAPFATIDNKGNYVPEAAIISIKAAYAMWALYDSPYTDALIEALAPIYDEYGGWFSGTYEKNGAINRVITLDCNAIILEALAFKAFGVLINHSETKGYWEKQLNDNNFEQQGLPPSSYQKEFQPLLESDKARPTP